MTLLCDLAAKYGTDKAWPHRYTPVYHEILAPRVESVRRVLEIGICVTRDIKNGRTGASLFMWEEFFPNAQIYGIDIDRASMVNKGRISSYWGDQGDEASLHVAVEGMGGPGFDVIVDDGSHDPVLQLAAARTMLPMLNVGGTYFIEDIYVDPKRISDALPPGFETRVYEGGKLLPEGFGRRDFGGPPAGEQLMIVEHASKP